KKAAKTPRELLFNLGKGSVDDYVAGLRSGGAKYNEKGKKPISKIWDGLTTAAKVTPKDFRTKRANIIAINEVAASKQKKPFKDWDDYKEAVLQIAEKVSSVLGNSPAMCVNSYMDIPAVFGHWEPTSPKPKGF